LAIGLCTLLLAAMAAAPCMLPAHPDLTVKVVRAENGYFVAEDGTRVGREDAGRRLQISNVKEVRDLELVVSSVDTIVIRGDQQLLVFRLDQLPSSGGRPGRNICEPRNDGSNWLVPLAGRWTAEGELRGDGGGATLACASGALGKCLQWGFAPTTSPDNFTACTRMVRADYCGDGHSHTRPGILIGFDRLHGSVPAAATRSGFRFEALWSADGAHCVSTTRVPELFAIDDLLKECPERADSGADYMACRDHERPPAPTPILANFVAISHTMN
jgi:hypothetical protein